MSPAVLLVRIDGHGGCHEAEGVEFQESLDPSLLGLEGDKEIFPASEVRVAGRAYQVSDWVVVEARIETSVTLLCLSCNEPFELPIIIPSWRHEVPSSCIRNGMIDLTGPLREEILLEVPLFAKCGGAECSNIGTLRQYLRSSGLAAEDEHNQPLSTLL